MASQPAGNPTLFQQMMGKGGQGNNNMGGGANKSIKEKRMDFELNQQAAQAHRSAANNAEGGFDRALKEA